MADTAKVPPDLSAFGAFQPLRRLIGGHRNSVWLAEGPNGLYVAKSTRRSAAALDWLTPFEAAARKCGFGVPAPLCVAGQRVHQGWTLEPFVDGLSPTDAQMRALAPRIASLHQACPSLPQRPGFCSLPALLQADVGGDIDLRAMPNPVRVLCRKAWLPFAAARIRPIHGDLTAANVILSPQGPTLLDWDEARCDLAFFDAIALRGLTPDETAAHLAFEIASSWHLEPSHARHVLARFDAAASQPVAKR